MTPLERACVVVCGRLPPEIPMTETEWLASTDSQVMLQALDEGNLSADGRSHAGRAPQGPWYDRKLRLFACACCRAVWDEVACPRCGGEGEYCRTVPIMGWMEGMPETCRGTGRVGGLTDPRSRRAVEVAERYADGEATERELAAAQRAACQASPDGLGGDSTPVWAAAPPAGLVPALANLARCDAPLPAAQAALIRDIFGNPFRPKTLCGKCVDCRRFDAPCPDCGLIRCWNDGSVPRMAEEMYRLRDFTNMPVLHDALLDAGCDDEDILNHCRGCWACKGRKTEWPGGINPCRVCGGKLLPHARGCWVIDLLLGKS